VTRETDQVSALRAVKDGKLALTVELNMGEWGRLGVDVLAGYLKGETFKPRSSSSTC